MSASELSRDLLSLLRRSEGGHFFARPLLDTLVFLDLDAPAPDAMNNVYRLRPRAVVQTSAVGLIRNYQAWIVMDPKTARARQASMATRALQEALGSDPNSTSPHQQGRMPGSRNNKLSLQPSQPASIIHESPGEFMDDAVFMSVTARTEPKVRVQGNNLIVAPLPEGQPREADQSNSGKDWANAMRFFEVDPYASMEAALSGIQWLAERNNTKYYRESTVKKAMTLVHSRMRGQRPNLGAIAPPGESLTPTRSAPAITLTPKTKNRAKNVLGRSPGEGAKGGADVLKMVANCLLDVAERLDKVEKAALQPEIPTEDPDPPQMTQRAMERKGCKCHECQRRKPRECFSETQWKRGDAAGRKCKTCCSNAACGVVLAKPCVGCGNLKQRESFSATQWERKESKCADCLSGPKSLGRPNYPRGEGRPGEKPAGSGVVSKTQPCSAATDGGGAGSPGGLAASPHRSPTQEEEAESDGGQELLRNAAELGGTSEPFEVDVPGDGGCLFHALTLEKRRLDGRPAPPTTADLIRESAALRLEVNKANRDWIDGLCEEERTEAQWAVQGELIDEARHTFTTWEAYFEFMDRPTSFGTFFSIAGFLRLMKEKSVGANVWVQTDNGYRLQRDGRGDGATEENVVHLLYDGRNHYAALRNPPTDWALQTKTDLVILGPPEAANGQRETREAAAPQLHDVGKSTDQGCGSGSEIGREQATRSTFTGTKKIARNTCKVCGVAKERGHFTPRQWKWRSLAPTCNQCQLAISARPERTRACARCGKEKTRNSYSATQWSAPAHVVVRCLTCPPAEAPKPQETRKTCALCGIPRTKRFYSGKQWDLQPHTAPRRCQECIEGRRERASSEEERGPGVENAAQPAQGATEDAEPAEEEEPEHSGTAQTPIADEPNSGRKRQRELAATRKLCATCDVEKERIHFSGTQWEKAVTEKRKCKDCLASTGGGATAMRECRGCKSVVAREDFSKTQWAEPTTRGSLCGKCASTKLSEPAAEETSELHPVAPFSNKEEATRFIMQSAKDDELPSASRPTLQAMGAIIGKDTRGWALEKDPEYTADQKLGILRKIHTEDLAHAAGAAGVVRNLKSIDRSWTHCWLDARFLIMRCVFCARKTTRGCAEVAIRHLPKPLHSGECVGVDLKTVLPTNEPGGKWVMLLAVDFTSGKVFAWDIDCGKVTVQEVQSRLVGDFMSNNDPPVILWSDNGGQFKTVLEQLFQELLFCKCAFIPPGHPASNGYVEVLNRILSAMHGGERRRLGPATRAYNAKTKDRIGAAPETIWRALRPLTSRWTHMAAQEAIRKIDGAGQSTLDAEEELGDYMQRVAERGKDGRLLEAVDSFEERMGPIMKAIGDRNDRKDIAGRLKWRRGPKRQKKFGLVSGDRVLLKNTQVTASAAAPFAPEVYEVTQVLGALLLIRSTETGKLKTVHNENCKLCPHTIAVSDEEREEAKRGGATKTGDAAAPLLHAVLRDDQKQPATTTKKRSERKKTKSALTTKATRGRAKSAPKKTRRTSNEEIIRRWFRPPGFTKFDQLPSRPKEFTEVEAGVLRCTQEKYDVRPNVTAAREVLTLVGDETTCVLKVDDGPKSRHRQWLSDVRRRVAAGEVPSLRLSLKAVKGKGYRGANKVILRLKPKTTPALETYSKIYQKKKKLKPMTLPPAAG